MNNALREIGESVKDFLPARTRENLWLKAFGLAKMPMILFIGPVVEEVTEERCVLKIPLNRRTRNHLDVMYIACLVAGADLAGGVMALRVQRVAGLAVNVLFKDFKAEFLKRVEGDCFFTCVAGESIKKAMLETTETGERVNLPIEVVATVPSKLGDEPVARFELTMTMKRRKR